jgi:hypothetical protein
VVEPLARDTRTHVRADDDREDRFDSPAGVLVEGDDEQAVVASRRARVPIEMPFIQWSLMWIEQSCMSRHGRGCDRCVAVDAGD